MNQKGSILPLVLVIITLAAALGYFVYENAQLKKEKERSTVTIVSTPIPSSTPVPSPTPEYSIFEDKLLKINYFPVQNQQKVAQTFTLDEDETIEAVKLKASFGVGKNIMLDVYEAGNVNDLTKGKLVGQGSFLATDIVDEEPFEVILENPILIKANKEYAMVIYADDSKTQTAIGFSEKNSSKNGMMFKYTRLVGGNGVIIDQKNSWQPANSQDLLYTFKTF